MKKNLILAAAVAIVAGQLQMIDTANAAKGSGTGREAKPGAVVGREVRDAKGAARTSARTGADAGSLRTVLAEAKEAGNLTTMEVTALGRNMSQNPEVATGVKEAIAQTKNDATREMGQERILGLALFKFEVGDAPTASALAAMTPDAVMQQALSSLYLGAGREASAWADKGMQDNLVFLMKTVKERKLQGRTDAEAMREALELMPQPTAKGGRGVRVTAEDIINMCKRKKA